MYVTPRGFHDAKSMLTIFSRPGFQSSALREENARLTAELREAREQIRNLELQIDEIKANTRRAVEALNLS